MADPENRYPNLKPGYVPAHRVGRNQRLARYAMIAAGSSTVTTAQLMEIIYPDKPWPKWRWTDVREAAERYGERVKLRERPLRWRLKPGALEELRKPRTDMVSAADEPKDE